MGSADETMEETEKRMMGVLMVSMLLAHGRIGLGKGRKELAGMCEGQGAFNMFGARSWHWDN